MTTGNQDTARVARIIEAYLFAEGDSVPLKKLVASANCSDTTLALALDMLTASLEGRGMTLVRTEKEAALAISSDAKEVLETLYTREVERDIGDAGLEVLGVVLYRGPSSRSDIDYIRGVNSSSTIRSLLARGLVERAGNPADGREYLYRPTTELLAHLGVSQAKFLPEYDTITAELQSFESQKQVFHGDTTEPKSGDTESAT